MECVTCVCVWVGVGGVGGESIGFGLYQSWRNMGNVGYVCVLVAVVLVLGGGNGWAAWAREGWVVLCLCVL